MAAPTLFLRQETDEQHPMAATVVCRKLNDMEVACDRRTLTGDIQALNDYGYEVMTTMISHEKACYNEFTVQFMGHIPV